MKAHFAFQESLTRVPENMDSFSALFRILESHNSSSLGFNLIPAVFSVAVMSVELLVIVSFVDRQVTSLKGKTTASLMNLV